MEHEQFDLEDWLTEQYINNLSDGEFYRLCIREGAL